MRPIARPATLPFRTSFWLSFTGWTKKSLASRNGATIFEHFQQQNRAVLGPRECSATPFPQLSVMVWVSKQMHRGLAERESITILFSFLILLLTIISRQHHLLPILLCLESLTLLIICFLPITMNNQNHVVFVGEVSEGTSSSGRNTSAQNRPFSVVPRRSLTRTVFLNFIFVCVLICTLTDFSCCVLLVYYLSVIICFRLCKTVSVKNGWPAR